MPMICGPPISTILPPWPRLHEWNKWYTTPFRAAESVWKPFIQSTHIWIAKYGRSAGKQLADAPALKALAILLHAEHHDLDYATMLLKYAKEPIEPGRLLDKNYCMHNHYG